MRIGKQEQIHTQHYALRCITTTYKKPTEEAGGTERKAKAIQYSEEEFAHGNARGGVTEKRSS